MALRKILTKEHPTLHKICRPVTAFDERLALLLDDLKQTVQDADGVGLAAPQVGILRRAVIVDNGEELLELVNPVLTEQSGEQDGEEGCLSVPGEYGMVKRPNHVRVKAQDRNGNWREYEGTGLTARCICHELDHLDGRLYTEVAYKMLTEQELQELSERREQGQQ